MAFQNLSFETVDGSGPGCADGWTFASTSRAGTWAGYHTAPNGRAWEDFEREWLSNQNYLFAFGLLGITRAEYQSAVPPKTYENFEEYWSSNQSYVYGIAGTVAAYDTTPQIFEDFEEEWFSNESYLYEFVGVGTDLTAAAFDVTPEDFEDFEEDWDANESYLFAFVGVGTDLTAALYAASAYEDFENPAGAWPVCNTV